MYLLSCGISSALLPDIAFVDLKDIEIITDGPVQPAPKASIDFRCVTVYNYVSSGIEVI